MGRSRNRWKRVRIGRKLINIEKYAKKSNERGKLDSIEARRDTN